VFCSGIHNDNVAIRKYTAAGMKLSAVCLLLLVPLAEVCSFRFIGNVVQVVTAVDLDDH